MPRFTSNPALRPEAVADPSADAAAFHVRIPGWRETPVRQLDGVARELGLAGVALKDESDRLGLPAFKVLGASWAVERALREAPDTRTLVAASAGNHGRAVAHVAAMRGLACRIFVPARAAADRRAAIEGEGAELVVVDGTYEDAVRLATEAAAEPGALALADVGDSGPAHWVIDGYHTLFAEAAAQAGFDALLVPAGVGSFAAAAARYGALAGKAVIAVEPSDAACVGASLGGGRARRRGDARDADGRDGLRRGLPRGLAVAARRARGHDRRERRRGGRRDARARGARVRDRRLRGRAAGGAAGADDLGRGRAAARRRGAGRGALAGAARGDRGGHRPSGYAAVV